jgi:hypothetical protein
MRYFRAPVAVYEQARQTLNAAWGLPDSETETCIPPVAECHVDSGGLAYLAVDDAMAALPPADEMLRQLIDAGLAAELTEGEFVAIVNGSQA